MRDVKSVFILNKLDLVFYTLLKWPIRLSMKLTGRDNFYLAKLFAKFGVAGILCGQVWMIVSSPTTFTAILFAATTFIWITIYKDIFKAIHALEESYRESERSADGTINLPTSPDGERRLIYALIIRIVSSVAVVYYIAVVIIDNDPYSALMVISLMFISMSLYALTMFWPGGKSVFAQLKDKVKTMAFRPSASLQPIPLR